MSSSYAQEYTTNINEPHNIPINISNTNQETDPNMASNIYPIACHSKDKSDYLIGGVKLQNNKCYVSNIAKYFLDIDTKPDEQNITTVEEFRGVLQNTLGSICFSSKRIGIDEFTERTYNDSEIISSIITGIANHYEHPYGIILYHPINQFYFDCSIIEYIITHKMIPLEYTNLNLEQDYIINRSDGSKNKAKLYSNSSIILNSKNKLKVRVKWGDYIKDIFLTEFLFENNITHMVITNPLINHTKYKSDLDKDILENIVAYYNTSIVEFLNNIFKTYLPEFDITTTRNVFILNKKLPMLFSQII